MIFKNLKKLKKAFIVMVVLLFFVVLLSQGRTYKEKDLSYGVTFSKKHALSLGLDWQKLYLAIIDDLGVDNIRIPAYWDEVEAERDRYNYDDLDWQIKKAKEKGVKVILAVGGRLPRWPECHFPGWTDGLAKKTREKEALEYTAKTVERYRDHDNIFAWQVENEFFLAGFGQCPNLGADFLDAEIEMVKKLDPLRPIIITDSGELSLWVPAAKRADIFGTSLYLNTYSQTLKNYIHYPITPGFFHFKRNVASLFARPDDWVIIELQAEPWGPIPYQFMNEKEKSKTMDLEKFKHIIDFSRRAGFKDFYLWGVEWWWWEKEKNGNPRLWEEAKKLF